MGKFFVEVFCGKLCGGGEVKAFIDRSSVKYPSTFASKYATASDIILSSAKTLSPLISTTLENASNVVELGYKRPKRGILESNDILAKDRNVNKMLLTTGTKQGYKPASCGNAITSLMKGENGAKPEAEKKRRPTIVDIANRAGVAPMTVSRVIKELNYHPNGLARSLKRQRTHVVGILLPDIANPFSAELVRGIQEALLPRGYSSFISVSERSIQREQAALRALFDHRADGIVIATRETKAGNDFLLRLAERDLPMVVVGRALNHQHVDRVTADHWKGAYEAVEHLIALGHKRIGFVGVSAINGAGLRRYQGYLDALREHDLPIDEKLIAGPSSQHGPGQVGPGYSTQDDGYAGMKRLLALKKRPTAVFARNDFTAMGAICAIRDAGLSIPEDVAIVGFDNVPLAAYTAPPLTTVDQPTKEQGREAAQLLLERIEGERARERREICLDCHLVIRQSTVNKVN
jgi:DNA-binding LacI/PurR family transcriptional regulator